MKLQIYIIAIKPTNSHERKFEHRVRHGTTQSEFVFRGELMTQAPTYETVRRGNPISGAVNYVKGHFRPIPIAGGLLGTGSGYWVGLLYSAAREIVAGVPQIVQSIESNQTYRALDQVYQAFQKGQEVGADWAVGAGIVSLLLTYRFQRAIGKFITGK